MSPVSPVDSVYSLHSNDLERRRAADERHRQNKARLAQAYARYQTDGTGSEQFEDPVDFGLTFLERPFISVGHILDLDELAEELGLDEEDPEIPIPLATTYVVEWDRDDNGFYVGAWCAARVSFDTETQAALDPDFRVTIQHHLTFSAIAMKDVPPDAARRDLADEVEEIVRLEARDD